MDHGPRTVLAKVVQLTDQNMLVEWTDEKEEIQRGWLPRVEGIAPRASLPILIEHAIPYGEPLFVDDIHVSAAALNNALKRRGLWTRTDIQKRPQEALGAFLDVASLTIAHINRDKF